MDEYHLEPGELVIMQTEGASFPSSEKTLRLDKVVLTNRNLILYASRAAGLLNREKLVKRCPLEGACDASGEPRVSLIKQRNDCFLQIAYEDETVTLRFSESDKRQARLWTDAVRAAAVGDFANIKTEERLPGDVADLIDNAKGFVGAVFPGFGSKAKADQQQGEGRMRPAVVARKCQGCHAPLSGRRGSTVTCPYCDTKQML